VCAKKRESIVVLLDLLDLHIPAPHVVALVAAGSELSLVNIGVTVGALPSDIREDRLGVALGARYALVQSTQGEARGLVVELRNARMGFHPSSVWQFWQGTLSGPCGLRVVAWDCACPYVAFCAKTPFVDSAQSSNAP
jgi:hypothetical protein